MAVLDPTTVKLRLHGTNGVDVRWFGAEWVTDAAIRSLVTKALGLLVGPDIVCRHPCDGSFVALGGVVAVRI